MLNGFRSFLLLLLLLSGRLGAEIINEEGNKQLKELGVMLKGKTWLEEPALFPGKGTELNSSDVSLVFKEEHIPAFKLTNSKNNVCRTFYVQLTDVFFSGKTKQVNDLPPIYFEILRYNSYLPFALVDEQKDLKINVGWTKNAPKKLIVTRGKASSESTCRGIEDVIQFVRTISSDVLYLSLNKVDVRRFDGVLMKTFLFPAVDRFDVNYLPCKQEAATTFVRKFPYYIYLYDFSSDGIFPDRIELFKDKKIMLTDYFELYFTSEKPRTIAVAEGATCTESHYEAYGFTDNHSSLKRLVFATDEEAQNPSYGYLKGDAKNQGKLKMYRFIGTNKKEWFYLSPSRIPGEVTLEPIKEPSQNKKASAH